MTTFYAPEKNAFRKNILEKGENDGNQHFPLFSQCFYLMEEKFNVLIPFPLPSVNAFNLDKSKILSADKKG